MAQHSSTARMPALAAKAVDLADDPQNRSPLFSLHLSSGGGIAGWLDGRAPALKSQRNDFLTATYFPHSLSAVSAPGPPADAAGRPPLE